MEELTEQRNDPVLRVAYLQELQELDTAVAAYREQIKKYDFTETQAIDQLFK